jgi:uncharacterized protein YidB (DUF937 family)
MMMSILDDISGLMNSGGAPPDQAKSNIGNALGDILKGQGINGIPGMIQQFEQSGLGAQAASWVGGGANQPVSAGGIAQALGPGVIGAIASRFGIDPNQATQMLSQHLPGIVDHMTPGGTLPGGTLPNDVTSAAPSDGTAPDDPADDDDGADDSSSDDDSDESK